MFAIHGTVLVHMHVRLQVQSRDVSIHCSPFYERWRCADLTCGAMTARRFYEPFFAEPRCSFSDDQTNERSLLSASQCRERRCRNARNMQRRLRPMHRSNAAVLLCPPPPLSVSGTTRVSEFIIVP